MSSQTSIWSDSRSVVLFLEEEDSDVNDTQKVPIVLIAGRYYICQAAYQLEDLDG